MLVLLSYLGFLCAVGTTSTKVFVGHSIYKGKAALTVEPRSPEFTSLDSGAYKLSREGIVLLQCAPTAGTRVYDWSRKQVAKDCILAYGTVAANYHHVIDHLAATKSHLVGVGQPFLITKIVI
ncbi:single-stranded DNA-binding protein WHY1, chloroplastic-like [Syzygium oleosum]|uniref:single-stranded DNA-binding protein WHY1, chloroplastic-like n=1 Tax=Syzygium oleosum TaxID=219896 RepID=UPI0024B8A69C|nr:single-stranded DNA-binding protein WHY1, chloroplastic-like [Syzygium oleosum]